MSPWAERYNIYSLNRLAFLIQDLSRNHSLRGELEFQVLDVLSSGERKGRPGR